MDCSEVRKHLDTESEPFTAALEDHLAGCEECALAALEKIGEPLRDEIPQWDVQETEAVLGRVEQRLADERGIAAWLRSRPTRMRMALGAVAAIGVPLAYAAVQPRIDLDVYPKTRLIALALTLLALAVISLGTKLRPLHQPRLWAGLPALLAVASLALMAVDAALPAAHASHPASLLGSGSDFIPRAVACLAAGLVIGLPALLLTAIADRSNDGWRDASLLGATLAGLAGYLALHLHCPLVAPAHLLAGHLSVLVVFLAVYTALRPRAR